MRLIFRPGAPYGRLSAVSRSGAPSGRLPASPRSGFRLRSRRGLSLADVLVAIVILSIGLVIILSHIIQTRKGTNATLEELKGIGYAQDLVDRVKCTPYDKVPEMKGSEDEATFAALKIADAEIRKVPEPFKRRLTVEEFTEDLGGRDFKMKRVEVRVSWVITNFDDKNRTVARDVDVVLRTIVRKLVN